MQITIIKLLLYSNYKRGKMTQVFPESDGKKWPTWKENDVPKAGAQIFRKSGAIYQMVENFAELSEQSWSRFNGQVIGPSEVQESWN